MFVEEHKSYNRTNQQFRFVTTTPKKFSLHSIYTNKSFWEGFLRLVKGIRTSLQRQQGIFSLEFWCSLPAKRVNFCSLYLLQSKWNRGLRTRLLAPKGERPRLDTSARGRVGSGRVGSGRHHPQRVPRAAVATLIHIVADVGSLIRGGSKQKLVARKMSFVAQRVKEEKNHRQSPNEEKGE